MKVTFQPQNALEQASGFFYKIPGTQTVCAAASYFFNALASAVNYFLTLLHLRSTTDLTEPQADLETPEQIVARRTARIEGDQKRAAEANKEFTPLKRITQYFNALLFPPSNLFSENQALAIGRIDKAQEEGATSLDLSGLKLTGKDVEFLLPKIKNQLPSLIKLDLSFNPLGLFSPSDLQELGELTALTHLNLQTTRLAAVPEAIYRLENLTTLHLGGNELPSIPERLAELPNLAVLKIKRKHQPSGLKRLPYTEQQIPQALRNKPGLQINKGPAL